MQTIEIMNMKITGNKLWNKEVQDMIDNLMITAKLMNYTISEDLDGFNENNEYVSYTGIYRFYKTSHSFNVIFKCNRNLELDTFSIFDHHIWNQEFGEHGDYLKGNSLSDIIRKAIKNLR